MTFFFLLSLSLPVVDFTVRNDGINKLALLNFPESFLGVHSMQPEKRTNGSVLEESLDFEPTCIFENIAANFVKLLWVGYFGRRSN